MRINVGMTFDGDGLRRKLEQAKLRGMDRHADRVRGLRCREHGKGAEIIPQPDGYNVRTRCEAFRAEVVRTLNA